MEMEVLLKRAKEISEEYNYSHNRVIFYLKILLQYPFVVQNGEDRLLACLEEIVSERVSQYFARSMNLEANRSLNDTIAEMLYRNYDEQALRYLNEDFLRIRNLLPIEKVIPEKKIANFNGFDDFDDSKLAEKEYQGYR